MVVLICVERTERAATVSQTNIGTVSKATLGKLLRDPSGVHLGFSERIDTIIRYTQGWILSADRTYPSYSAHQDLELN